MIHVYHFILDHRVGGPHAYVDTLRNALEGKIDSTIITTGRGPMTDLAIINLRHLWAPLYAIELIANTLLLIYLVLSKRIKRKDAIFNVHGSANIAPIAAARVVGIPVVWHFHETVSRFRRLVTLGRWLLNTHPHALVVVADRAKEIYGLDEADLIPGAVDNTFWSRNETRMEEIDACDWTGANGDSISPYRVIAVANLNPLKGIDILLDAMAEVEGPWHLKIAGSELGTHREYAMQLYTRAQEIISGNQGCAINFLGWQEKTQVRALLASADLFVLPSRSEACPIALLEAMAMGCVCVAADVGDVDRIIKTGCSAKMVAAESSSELSAAIKDSYINHRHYNIKKNTPCSTAYYAGDNYSNFATETLSIYQRISGMTI